MLSTILAAENEIAGVDPTIFWGTIVFAVVCAILCGVVAGRKGRSTVLWFISGLIFNLISLIVIMVLPSRRT